MKPSKRNTRLSTWKLIEVASIKKTGTQAYLGIVNPGLVDQCKTTVRPPVEPNVVSGFDGSYKGQYVDTRRFRRTWLLDTGFGTILETLACANACGEDEGYEDADCRFETKLHESYIELKSIQVLLPGVGLPVLAASAALCKDNKR